MTNVEIGCLLAFWSSDVHNFLQSKSLPNGNPLGSMTQVGWEMNQMMRDGGRCWSMVGRLAVMTDALLSGGIWDVVSYLINSTGGFRFTYR